MYGKLYFYPNSNLIDTIIVTMYNRRSKMETPTFIEWLCFNNFTYFNEITIKYLKFQLKITKSSSVKYKLV